MMVLETEIKKILRDNSVFYAVADVAVSDFLNGLIYIDPCEIRLKKMNSLESSPA